MPASLSFPLVFSYVPCLLAGLPFYKLVLNSASGDAPPEGGLTVSALLSYRGLARGEHEQEVLSKCVGWLPEGPGSGEPQGGDLTAAPFPKSVPNTVVLSASVFARRRGPQLSRPPCC
jgi:hypothetical protein